MAQNENDMSGRRARDAGETLAVQKARHNAFDADAPSASEIGRAVADAMARSKDLPPQRLGDIVRASCRVGFNADMRPKSFTFPGADTADGRECTVAHGKPIRLKVEAFRRYAEQGVVTVAE